MPKYNYHLRLIAHFLFFSNYQSYLTYNQCNWIYLPRKINILLNYWRGKLSQLIQNINSLKEKELFIQVKLFIKLTKHNLLGRIFSKVGRFFFFLKQRNKLFCKKKTIASRSTCSNMIYIYIWWLTVFFYSYISVFTGGLYVNMYTYECTLFSDNIFLTLFYVLFRRAHVKYLLSTFF